jgi:hypothetical protein
VNVPSQGVQSQVEQFVVVTDTDGCAMEVTQLRTIMMVAINLIKKLPKSEVGIVQKSRVRSLN